MKNKREEKNLLLPVVVTVALLCTVLGLMLACSQPEQRAALVNVFLDKDSDPPVLLSVKSVASSIVRIDFDEPVKVYGDSFGSCVARADGKSVYVTLDSSLQAGVKADLKGRVQDYYGNTTGFSVGVWGYNPNVPSLVINEFTTKRDTRNQDRTELFAMTGGNLAGVTLYCGTPDDYDAKFMFPDVDVKKGDYIVVWWVKDDYPEDRIDSPGVDFAAKCSKTPSDNNGVMVLTDSPSQALPYWMLWSIPTLARVQMDLERQRPVTVPCGWFQAVLGKVMPLTPPIPRPQDPCPEEFQIPAEPCLIRIHAATGT